METETARPNENSLQKERSVTARVFSLALLKCQLIHICLRKVSEAENLHLKRRISESFAK